MDGHSPFSPLNSDPSPHPSRFSQPLHQVGGMNTSSSRSSFEGETAAPSGRTSADYNDGNLDDLEKNLVAIHSNPSLRPDSLPPSPEKGTRTTEGEKNYQGEVTGVPVDPTNTNSSRPHLPLRARIAHFTWAWYTLTMSTGGLSLLIHAQPHQFPGLRQIGFVVYILNIILFTLVTSLLLGRFVLHRGSLIRSLTHQREGFFFPTFFLSIATLITSTQRYCVPSDPEVARAEAGYLLWAIQVAFWTYLALTTSVAIGQYSFIFSTHNLGLQTMMPTWILPIFPIMLSGTIAAVIADTQPAASGVPIIVAGLTCQGLGLAVASMMYAHMVGRLMQSGLPNREHRTGLFMCVGPPAFTALALLGLAKGLPNAVDHNKDGIFDAQIVETLAVVGAGFLWALSFWWFGIAVLAVVQSPPKWFHLGWWAAVFPNTGFTLATIALANEFRNEAVSWFATGMSILLLFTYLFVLYHNVRAVVAQDIMYPGRDEDVEDH